MIRAGVAGRVAVGFAVVSLALAGCGGDDGNDAAGDGCDDTCRPECTAAFEAGGAR